MVYVCLREGKRNGKHGTNASDPVDELYDKSSLAFQIVTKLDNRTDSGENKYGIGRMECENWNSVALGENINYDITIVLPLCSAPFFEMSVWSEVQKCPFISVWHCA